jgi:hypothetical protein
MGAATPLSVREARQAKRKAGAAGEEKNLFLCRLL